MITLVPSPIALKEMHFAAGLPGFPTARRFDCAFRGRPDSPFVVLTGHGPVAIRFVLVAPELYFRDYRPDFSAEHLSSVGLSAVEDGLVLVIVTLGSAPGQATANLLGPLLINPDTGEAIQAVQHEGSWATRAPLPPAGNPSGDEG